LDLMILEIFSNLWLYPQKSPNHSICLQLEKSTFRCMTDTMKTHVHLHHPNAFSVSHCTVTALDQKSANSTVQIFEINMVRKVLDLLAHMKIDGS